MSGSLHVVLFGEDIAQPEWSDERYWGAAVASQSFALALIHGERDFRVSIVSHDEHLGSKRFPPIASPNVGQYGYRQFCDIYGADNGVVIQSLSMSIERACHLRWLARNPSWAVVGMTHDLFDKAVFRGLLADCAVANPYRDTIVCCSLSARYVAGKLLDRVDAVLKKSYNFYLPVVPHVVEKPSLKPVARDHVKAELGFSQSSCLFLYVGRLSRLHKADLVGLVKCFERYFSELDAGLILAGGASDSESVKYVKEIYEQVAVSRCGNKIRILDNVSPQLKHNLLSGSDVMVSPANSFQESFGLALVEGLLYQLPVVCTNWNGYRDIITENETGYLIPVKMRPGLVKISELAPLLGRSELAESVGNLVEIDWQTFGERLLDLYESRDHRVAMGYKAVKFAREKFSWERVLRRYRDAWDRAVSFRSAEIHSDAEPHLDLESIFGSIPGPSGRVYP